MKQKVPLTYAEHVVLGKQLKQVRVQLLRLAIKAAPPIRRSASRALTNIDKLRCELDNELCKSLPLTDNSWRGVYYGNQ